MRPSELNSLLQPEGLCPVTRCTVFGSAENARLAQENAHLNGKLEDLHAELAAHKEAMAKLQAELAAAADGNGSVDEKDAEIQRLILEKTLLEERVIELEGLNHEAIRYKLQYDEEVKPFRC